MILTIHCQLDDVKMILEEYAVSSRYVTHAEFKIYDNLVCTGEY